MTSLTCKKKFALRSTMAWILLTLAYPSSAAIIFNLDQNGCSVGCNVQPVGTVSVSQFAVNDVLVSLQLGPDYSLRGSNDPNHHSLVFNLSGNPAVSISGVTSGDTDSQTFSFGGPGTFNDSPFGDFGYALECTTCTPGMAGMTTRRLSFHLLASGLTEGSFVATSGIFFAVDVVGKTSAAGIGLTGNVGALAGDVTPPDGGVPEVSTGGMLAIGAILLAFGRRLR